MRPTTLTVVFVVLGLLSCRRTTAYPGTSPPFFYFSFVNAFLALLLLNPFEEYKLNVCSQVSSRHPHAVAVTQ
jgi:hypothetical protein